MLWSYFGAGHGKGEHDGMGAAVKKWLRHYQLQWCGVDLNNALDVVSLLQANFRLGAHSTFQKKQRHQETILRVFHHVPNGQVNRAVDLSCDTVKGTRNKIF